MYTENYILISIIIMYRRTTLPWCSIYIIFNTIIYTTTIKPKDFIFYIFRIRRITIIITIILFFIFILNLFYVYIVQRVIIFMKIYFIIIFFTRISSNNNIS